MQNIIPNITLNTALNIIPNTISNILINRPIKQTKKTKILNIENFVNCMGKEE